MLVFLSWSGERSKAVAEALREWLPDVVQNLAPWMSQVDIAAGSRWLDQIGGRLEEARAGIVCLTPENAERPWLMFESGALAKTVSSTLLCPYLLAFEPSALPPGPLTQFQAKRANKEETLDLVRTLNNALGDAGLEDGPLDRAFARCWPELEARLTAIPNARSERPPQRSEKDMLMEVLELVRRISSRPATVGLTLDPKRMSARERMMLRELTGHRSSLGPGGVLPVVFMPSDTGGQPVPLLELERQFPEEIAALRGRLESSLQGRAGTAQRRHGGDPMDPTEGEAT